MNSEQYKCDTCKKVFQVKIVQCHLPCKYEKCLECFKKEINHEKSSILCFLNDEKMQFHKVESNVDHVPPELVNDCNLLESIVINSIKKSREILNVINKLKNGITNETEEIKRNLNAVNSFISNPFSNNIKLQFLNINPHQDNTFDESTILRDHPNRNFLQDCFPDRKIAKLNLYFRGSEHNFNSKLFHKFCDNKPETITVIKAKETDRVFGGYNPISWSSNNYGYFEANEAFLFQIDNKTKHIVDNNYNKAIGSHECYGPIFGENDLSIPNSYDGATIGNSNIGYTYSLPEGMQVDSEESKTYLAGIEDFEVEEYEVFGIEWI